MYAYDEKMVRMSEFLYIRHMGILFFRVSSTNDKRERKKSQCWTIHNSRIVWLIFIENTKQTNRYKKIKWNARSMPYFRWMKTIRTANVEFPKRTKKKKREICLKQWIKWHSEVIENKNVNKIRPMHTMECIFVMSPKKKTRITFYS